MTRDRIIARFAENATKAGAEVWRAKDREGMNRLLSTLLKGSGSIFCAALTELEKAVLIPPDRRSDHYESASLCLEEARGAIAETGSLIYSSQGGRVLQAGLLPAHHVAMVRAENIQEKLDDFFAALGDSPPTQIAFETGPSRTADIELEITLGVHGPERLSILILEEMPPQMK
ncbi:MAG: lactate utilization protein [candidate division NC10 bacterium]|nr:lactate utilization protein [candidate division NC10 bacterium]